MVGAHAFEVARHWVDEVVEVNTNTPLSNEKKKKKGQCTYNKL